MGKAYIKNGTPVGSESLCRTCSYALIFTGYRESEQVTMCTRVHPNLVLPFTVNTCTGYYDKNRPSYQQMERAGYRRHTRASQARRLQGRSDLEHPHPRQRRLERRRRDED